jgi:curli biogenesis system outer membrane secretion channel CsgG
MPRITHALAACALLSSLAACVATPPAPAPRPTQQQIADQRLRQVEGRIDSLGRRIDKRVNQGDYPPPQGASLHHRLEVIRREAHDMAAQHGGGLTSDEQRVLNQELDNAAHAIGE